jgi:hypothetical protein
MQAIFNPADGALSVAIHLFRSIADAT